jgi:hypothetical protein
VDPAKQYLSSSPRRLDADAFFAGERSSQTVTRKAIAYDLDQKLPGGRPGDPAKDGLNPVTINFPGWQNRFKVTKMAASNPLPQLRKDDSGAVDMSLRGWTEEVTYTIFVSSATPEQSEPRHVRVVILFGVGSEYYRHGLCGVIDVAEKPTILIDVPGIEPEHKIIFKGPTAGSQQELLANNRWGIGITEDTIVKIVMQEAGKDATYDIAICAAYSTGYLGLAGSINQRLFSFRSLERAIAFDCLYVALGQALVALKQASPATNIIAYIVTGAGNDFQDSSHPSFETLKFGGKPGFRYVNLFLNIYYYAVAASRVINEGDPPAGNEIISDMATNFQSALSAVTNVLPPRGTMISDTSIYRSVKGAIPSNGTILQSFAVANGTALRLFQNGFTGAIRRCLQNGQLLGWGTPPGEEWHDLLLIEFGWEYLT